MMSRKGRMTGVQRHPRQNDSRPAVGLAPLLAAIAMAAIAASTAHADVPASFAAAGALERAGRTQDASKNGTAASFGNAGYDDRHLFKLRWRLPFLASVGSGALGAGPFSSGFTSTGYAFGGVSFATESAGGLGVLVPQMELGEANKFGRLQLGALSVTQGHGTLVNSFTNSPDGLSRRAGVYGELNLAGLAGSVGVGDVLDPAAFMSARFAGRPLLWFMAPDATFQPNELDIDPRTEILGMWKIGTTVAGDFAAPTGRGLQTGTAIVAGLENEAALLDNQIIKVLLWLDINGLWTDDGSGNGVVGGAGLHPGATLQVDLGGLRWGMEGEMHGGGDGYVPRYFDRLYFVERSAVIGVDKAKLALERPGSWGGRLRSDLSLWKAVTAFAEVSEQRAWDTDAGNATGTLGLSTWILMAGGALTASQTGLGTNDLMGAGFVVTAEGRVGLMLNTIHLVGRAWRAHQPSGTPGEFLVEEGISAGVELNFDVL